jgi:hypothetical protein
MTTKRDELIQTTMAQEIKIGGEPVDIRSKACTAATLYVALTPALSTAQNTEEVYALIVFPRDGEVTIAGALGETYIMRRTDDRLSLGYPEGDYSGDPMVVDGFNKLMAQYI